MNNIIYVYKTSDETKDAYVVGTPTDEITGESINVEIDNKDTYTRTLEFILILIILIFLFNKFFKSKNKK